MVFLQNYKLLLSYDGTRYRGWQKQGNTPDTLQAKLETALSRLLEQPVEVNGSGRTDAGVHARGQVASFRAETELSCGEILDSLRRVLPEDMGAISLEPAEPRFHARLSCREKTYVYRVWNSPIPNVFERRYLTVVPEPLDIPAMERAAALLTGTHDYRSFCGNPHMKKSTVRTVSAIRLEPCGGELRLTFTGDGFLQGMVRILTGTLLEVGQGSRSPDTMPELLTARDRAQAGPTAPAKGLSLWEVRY